MNLSKMVKICMGATMLAGGLVFSNISSGEAIAIEKTVSANAVSSMDYLILTKPNASPLKLSLADYNSAYVNAILGGGVFSDMLNGYTVQHIITNDNKMYSLADYNSYYVDVILAGGQPTVISVLTSLAADKLEQTLPSNLEEGAFNGEEKLESTTPDDATEDFDVEAID